MKPTRPILRYHGGKWRIGPQIIPHFPPHRVYVEPFGGAGGVLLQKEPSQLEVYNDIESRVVSLFRVLRDPVKSAALRLQLELTPIARAEHKACQHEHPDEIEDARRLLVRSFQSVGAKAPGKPTGWRTRFRQRFNYQMSWNGWPEQMPAYVERLKNVLIESAPWQEILTRYDDEGVLFYIDPPYPLGTRVKNMWEAYTHEMTDADHEELCRRVLALRGHVVISSYANPIYCEMLSGWQRVDIKARAQTNAPRTESLWLSPSVTAGGPQRSLLEGL